jgi:hypothetical protein
MADAGTHESPHTRRGISPNDEINEARWGAATRLFVAGRNGAHYLDKALVRRWWIKRESAGRVKDVVGKEGGILCGRLEQERESIIQRESRRKHGTGPFLGGSAARRGDRQQRPHGTARAIGALARSVGWFARVTHETGAGLKIARCRVRHVVAATGLHRGRKGEMRQEGEDHSSGETSTMAGSSRHEIPEIEREA